MRIDRTRFGFIRATGTLMDRALQKVNLILQGMVDAKPYRLDWEHVLSEYDRLGVGDAGARRGREREGLYQPFQFIVAGVPTQRSRFGRKGCRDQAI